MPVPASINDLSTTAGSNSPPGSESPATIDDYLRVHASFIAQLRDSVAKGANKIINGNFSVNQRFVVGPVYLAAGQYGHDRWKAGAAGCTYTFSTTGGVTTLTISAGSLQQVIAGGNLQSGTHTLSWAGTAQGKIGGGSYSTSGVTGSVTGGSNLTVEFNVGSLSLVRFEQGSVATQFEHRLYEDELTLCQTYYELCGFEFVGYAGYVHNVGSRAKFSVRKRVTPTITQLGNNSSFASTNISTTTSTYVASPEGTLVYRSSSGAGACQFSEIFAASAEL